MPGNPSIFLIIGLVVSMLIGAAAEVSSRTSLNFSMYDDFSRPLNGGHVRNEDHLHLAHRARKTNVGRQELVYNTLEAAAGVYNDKAKGKSLGLEKTVITVLMSVPKSRQFYSQYFHNFLCYAKIYNYDLVVYVTRNRGDDYKQHLHHIKEIGKMNGVRTLPYPEELFWRLVYGKSMPVRAGAHHSRYVGDAANFVDYGALTMLVPTYEVVKSGYNCIYFDLDVALIVDPVPHMMLGDADFVSSIENRRCLDIAYAANAAGPQWDQVESNTGQMLLRSTPQSVAFFTVWLEAIVDNNYNNDQRPFDRNLRRKLNMTYASNCLPPSTPHVRVGPSIRNSNTSATYCFLSDIIFQNGYTALTCTKNQNMGQYTRDMIDVGIPGSAVLDRETAPHASPLSPGSARDDVTGLTTNIESTYVPFFRPVLFADDSFYLLFG